MGNLWWFKDQDLLVDVENGQNGLRDDKVYNVVCVGADTEDDLGKVMKVYGDLLYPVGHQWWTYTDDTVVSMDRSAEEVLVGELLYWVDEDRLVRVEDTVVGQEGILVKIVGSNDGTDINRDFYVALSELNRNVDAYLWQYISSGIDQGFLSDPVETMEERVMYEETEKAEDGDTRSDYRKGYEAALEDVRAAVAGGEGALVLLALEGLAKR